MSLTPKDVRLVIPMSGLGSRFLRAGYDCPKPLIDVGGRPLIAWVLRMFPGAENPLFICRREHIETTPMKEILMDLRPKGEIAVIEGAKKGPVDALLKAQDHIEDDRPVMVSYCDYYMQWDYAAFCAGAGQRACDGAVPCYTGFHPHLLPAKNLYASCKTDADGNLVEIKEKFSFEADKTKALHSPGAYYFKSGAILKKYGYRLMEREDSLNGEYYASMVYNHLVADGLKVWVPTGIPHFCQWGTPEDLADYLLWNQLIERQTA